MNWTDFVVQQWWLIALLVVLVIVLIVTESKKGGKSYSLHEATRLVNQDAAVIVDVREKKEFSAGHITDAVHIPYIKIAERYTELEKHKSKTIIVVDKMGQHASSASKTLRDNGFDAGRLAGGMAEWQAQNLPVIKA